MEVVDQTNPRKAALKDIARATSPSASLTAYVAAARRRLLARRFLATYGITGLVLGIGILIIKMMHRAPTALSVQFAMVICLFTAPAILAMVRCLRFSVPMVEIAKLLDQSNALKERVATAWQQNDSGNAFAALLAEDAENAASHADLSKTIDLRLSIALAVAAVILSIAVSFWHSPALPTIYINDGKAGASRGAQGPSIPSTGNQIVHTAPASKGQNPTGVAKRVPAASPPQSGAENAQNPADQNGTATHPKAQNSGSPQKGASNHAAGSNASAGSNGNTAGQGSDNPQQGARSQGAQSGGTPGSTAGQGTAKQSGSHGASQSGRSSEQRAGSPQSGVKKGSSGSGEGKKSAGLSSQNGKPGTNPSQNGTSNGNAAHQSGKSGHGAQSQSDATAREKSSASGAPGGLGGPGPPTGESGTGSPPVVHPKSLPPIANHSTFSYRLPKSDAKGRTQTSGDSGSKAHATEGALSSHVPSTPSASITAGQRSDERAVEQNTHIPAGYRSLVERYFGKSEGAAP